MRMLIMILMRYDQVARFHVLLIHEESQLPASDFVGADRVEDVSNTALLAKVHVPDR